MTDKLRATMTTVDGYRWELEGPVNQVIKGIAAVCAGIWMDPPVAAELEDMPDDDAASPQPTRRGKAGAP